MRGHPLLRLALLWCISPNSDNINRYTLSCYGCYHSPINLYFSCGNEWNRTTGTRIFSPLLYRLSYITNLHVPKDLNSYQTGWNRLCYHYTRDACYYEDREGFEPPNNGFAVHPFKPLRHLSLLCPRQDLNLRPVL